MDSSRYRKNRQEKIQNVYKLLGINYFEQAKDFKQYYVPRDDLSELDDLIALLKNGKRNVKILFSGNNGAGVTAEMNRLIFRLKRTHYTFYISAFQDLNIFDIDYRDLLSLIFVNLLEKLVKSSIIFKQLDACEIVIDFLSDVYELPYTTSISLNNYLLQSINKIREKLKLDEKWRHKIREKLFTPFRSPLLKLIDLYIYILLSKRKRMVIVCIDDFSKLEINKLEKFFNSYIYDLLEPNCKMVLAAPSEFAHNPAYHKIFEHIITIPELNYKNNGTLEEIIRRRTDNEILSDEELNEIVETNPKNINELITITKQILNTKMQNL